MKTLWNKRREPAYQPANQTPVGTPQAGAGRPAASSAAAPLDSIERRPRGTLSPAPGLSRLAPRALPQRRVVDMLQVTRLADEAAMKQHVDDAAAHLKQVAASYPDQPGPLVRLMALGRQQKLPHLQAEHAFGRICPAPADQAFEWLGIYGDRIDVPTHSAYRCTLSSILARYADVLSMPERRMLLTRVQTPTAAQPRTLLQRTLQAEADGDGAGLEALVAFCPSFWEDAPASLHGALEQALEIGAKAVFRTLIECGARPRSPLGLALTALRNKDLAVFCAALRFDAAIATAPFRWKRQHTEPVALVQVAIEIAGAQAGPFIDALGRFGACVMAYPNPSALHTPWRLAMQTQGQAMRAFVDTVDNLNAVDAHTQRSLLMDAAYYDYPWAINVLIKRGADASRRHDETGLTALDFAQTRGLVRCAGLLKDPTRTHQMLNEIVIDDDPDVQTELIACVAEGKPQMRDAWYESMRQIYKRHGSKYGATLSRILLQATAQADPADILDYASIVVAAPSDTSAKRMLEALCEHMPLEAVVALARQMRRHARLNRGLDRAVYSAIGRCVCDMPEAAVDLLANLALFKLRGASDQDLSKILLGFLALARQPDGVGAWPAQSVQRCRELDVSGAMRARLMITSITQTYQAQQALQAAKAQSDKPDAKAANANWRRTLLNWARSEGVKAAAEPRLHDAEQQLRQQAIQTLKQAASIAGRAGPMLVRGPREYALPDIEQVTAACHDENVVDYFDDALVAEHLITLLQALLGDSVLGQVFDAQAAQVPDARVLRRMFLSMHPDRAPSMEDKPRFDAMTALLNEIYTWCKDAAADKGAPPGPLLVAYRKRGISPASAGEKA